MAEQLLRLFQLCERSGGLPAKMRLAMRTGITQATAAVSPDSPEVVARVAAAVREITGQDAAE